MPDDRRDLLASLDPIVREHALQPQPLAFTAEGAVAARTDLVAHLDRDFSRWGRRSDPVPIEREIEERPIRLEQTGAYADLLDGAATGGVRLRLYHPQPGAVLPLHVHLHGGAWRTGSIDEQCTRHAARHLARRARVAVATVAYRLAPEHPWPAGLVDVLAAIEQLRDRGGSLGLDVASVSIGGVSAGANLAAAAVLAGTALRMQGLVLEVPALDLTGATALAARPGLAEDELRDVTGHYLADAAEATHPLVSPLLAPDLSGMPATWIISADLDPLQRDAVAFERRLAEARVPVEHLRIAGALHGSGILSGVWAPATRWQDGVVAAVAAAHSEVSARGQG